MEKKYGNFTIIVKEDYDNASAVAADVITKFVKTNPAGVLGLATGSTPEGTYSKLAEANHAGKVDFSNITTFNLDEYHPISKTNDQSYDYFMRQKLFNHININPSNVHLPNGEADPHAECVAYEAKIEDAGGICLQLLGIGANGHIGFNEPDTHFPKKTHYCALDKSTIIANSRFFESADDVPKNALTMGIGTIFNAKEILLVVTGEGKADIIDKALFGKIDPQVPASILQLHPKVTLVMDKAAAAKISPKL
ncbi:MAG: glucosamine-6-phosphate deaminase [Defluviitaleaceae bacterium]|nr:glucosamine-6-phosphate deaminase [Defluviitaleaceae bacterium]